MNTRLLQGIALAVLAVFFLARPALAQEEAEADTIYVSGDNAIVIIGDDGHRIIVRSAGDTDWPKLFVGDDFTFRPRTYSFRSGQRHAPKVEFHGRPFGDDDDKEFTVFSDYLGNFGSLFESRFGDDFAVHFGESMRERTEIMKMEM